MHNDNTFILEDVKVFDGKDFIEKGFVFVKDGRIEQTGAGKFEDSLASQDVPRISSPGDTVIPGLIDAHIHALSANLDSIQQSLRFGVTTVCDMHNNPKDNTTLKKLSNADKKTNADFKCAGLGAIVEGGWPIPILKKEFEDTPHGDDIIAALPKLRAPEEASPFVTSQVRDNGASYIKMFHELGDTLGMELPPPPHAIQKAVVDAAHENGVVAVGHAFSLAGAMALLEAGADGLTHIFFDKPTPQQLSAFIAKMKENNAHCNPTLGLCASQTGEGEDLRLRFLRDEFAQSALAERFKTPTKAIGFASAQKPRSSVENAYATTRALYKAGVPLVVGSDAAGRDIGTIYGLAVHMELYLLVNEIGMSPAEALSCATSITADRVGFHDRGSLEKGRKADLVLMKGDLASRLMENKPQCFPIKVVWRDGITSSKL